MQTYSRGGWVKPLTAHEAGLNIAANFAALNGDCSHSQIEPVVLALTGETVAAICAGCLRELPTSWL